METNIDISLSEPEKQLFDKVQVVVSEVHDKFSIWKEWHNYVTFESSNIPVSGRSYPYFAFGKKYTCYACFWIEKIEDYLTVFVDPCGAYQNYFELDKFVKKYFPNATHFIDSRNFHNHPACLNRSKRQIKSGRLLHILELEKGIDYLKKMVNETYE